MKYKDIKIELTNGIARIFVNLQHRVLSKKVKITITTLKNILDFSKRSSNGKDRFEVVMLKYTYIEDFNNCNFEDLKDNLEKISTEILEAEDISVKKSEYILATGMSIEALLENEMVNKMLISSSYLDALDFLKKKVVSAY